jgi:hypothetical protein
MQRQREEGVRLFAQRFHHLHRHAVSGNGEKSHLSANLIDLLCKRLPRAQTSGARR